MGKDDRDFGLSIISFHKVSKCDFLHGFFVISVTFYNPVIPVWVYEFFLVFILYNYMHIKRYHVYIYIFICIVALYSIFPFHICVQQGCIIRSILPSGMGARGVSSEHVENMEMCSGSPLRCSPVLQLRCALVLGEPCSGSLRTVLRFS